MASPLLLDHVPQLLDSIAEIADELAAGRHPDPPANVAKLHALERIDAGFDLSQVVAEYSALRDCALRMWTTETTDSDLPSTRALHLAIDRAVGESVDHYTRARDRTLVALDKISAAALETRSLENLLGRLLEVLVETTAAVDTALILLRDGDLLRARAAVGLEEAARVGWTVRIGEGFAGWVAESRRPQALEAAASDPRVASPILRTKGVKGLFGVPLIESGEVMGVAQMGSLTAASFSVQDQRLFIALANRATSAISLHILREQELARRAELEAVIESMNDAVFIGGPSGIERANRKALEFAGWTDADLMRPISELAVELDARDPITREPIAESDRPFNRALRGESVTRELLLLNTRRRIEMTARASAAPIRHGDRLIGAVAIMTDITEHKRLERELRDRYEEIAREARVREEMVAVVSHDLKNPLASIHLAATSLLARPDVPRKQLEAIERATVRMDHLIVDLLDMASIQAGRLAVERRPEDAAFLMREIIDIHEPMARQNGIRFVRECQIAETKLNADRDRIHQVFGNLLGNAIKFCRAGDTITLGCERRASDVMFSIADTGPGIDAAELPHVFEPYWSAKKYAKQGTGLGLYISKGIIEAHGGSMSVESTPGRGTVFRFTVPAEPLIDSRG